MWVCLIFIRKVAISKPLTDISDSVTTVISLGQNGVWLFFRKFPENSERNFLKHIPNTCQNADFSCDVSWNYLYATNFRGNFSGKVPLFFRKIPENSERNFLKHIPNMLMYVYDCTRLASLKQAFPACHSDLRRGSFAAKTLKNRAAKESG